MRRALTHLAPGEPADLGPLEDLGVTATPEPLRPGLHGDPGELPVVRPHLFHGDVVDGGGLLAVDDRDGPVEQLAEHERLGRALLEAPHVDQTGRDDLAGVEARDPCHRQEDRVASRAPR